jgi:hypothetical protein
MEFKKRGETYRRERDAMVEQPWRLTSSPFLLEA